MTTEEKFKAAVNVIRSLPKNGSYQPSNELMLRFYAYFKQATLGPCQGNRPAFWDIVGRAKFDAWKRLGDNMSKTEAMAKYIEELHTIVETLSFSEKVANFLEAPSNELDGVNVNDLELVAGDVLERVRSQPNSPIGSREGSPTRFLSNLSSSSSLSLPSVEDSDHSDDEYIDTIDEPLKEAMELAKLATNNILPNGNVVQENLSNKHHISRSRTKITSYNNNNNNNKGDFSSEISKTVENLRIDIERLTTQINTLEIENRKVLKSRKGLIFGLQAQSLVLIILWPVIINFVTNKWILKRK